MDHRRASTTGRRAGIGSASATRRQLLKLSGGLAGAGLLSACGGGSSGGDGAVRFQGWDFESQLVQQNIDRFMKLNPDTTVEYTPVTSAQYVQKMVAQFTAGSEPDALYVYDDSLAAWITAGYLQPLEGMRDLDKVYDALYPGNAKTMTYEGKRYGLPYYTDSQGLVYNAEILEKAGISAPPRTLDELVEQGQKIQDKGLLEHPMGLPAQLSDTWWSWWWGLVFASGGKMFDEENEPLMDGGDPVAQDVLTWMQAAANDSQVLDRASLQLLPIPFDNAFMAGQYAFVIAPRYAMRKYNDPKQSKVAGKARMAMMPSLDGTTEGTVSNTRMYCLTADTEVKESAYDLIYYLGGFDKEGEPYTAKFWFKEQGLGFAFKDLGEDPEVQAILEEFIDPEIYSKLAEVARPRTVIAAPWYTEYEVETQKLLQQVITKQATPAKAVKGMARTARTLKKQYA